MAPPTVICLDNSPSTGSGEGVIVVPSIGAEPTIEVFGTRDQQSETPATVLAQSEVPAVTAGQYLVMVENQTSGTTVVTSEVPSSSVVGCAPPLATERGKGVVVDEYESESDLDPDNVRMFEEGHTHSVVNAGDSTCDLQIPLGVNLLAEGEDLEPQFSLL